MAWVPILTALLGAGGSIGGGLLAGGDEGPGPRGALTVGGADPDVDPSLAALSFENLLNFGIVDPSILLNASPAQRARKAFDESLAKQKIKERGFWGLQIVLDNVFQNGLTPEEAMSKVSGKIRNGLFQLLAASGFDSIDQLIQAESSFRETMGPAIGELSDLAGNLQAGRINLLSERNRLLQNLPDVTAGGLEDIRQQEKQRILSNLDEVRRDALRESNILGVNPGRRLSEIDEFVANDIELESLNRAISLLSGQQGLATTQLGLLGEGLDQPARLAQNIASLRSGGSVIGGTGGGGLGNAALGQGVSQAAGLLGAGIFEAFGDEDDGDDSGGLADLLGLASQLQFGSSGSSRPASDGD